MKTMLLTKFIGLMLMAILIASCDTTQVDDPNDSCNIPNKIVPQLKEGTKGAVIITDSSGSMQGFTSQDSTKLFTLHDILNRAARAACVQDGQEFTLKRAFLGTGLESLEPSFSLDGIDKGETYKAEFSRLDLFFTLKSTPRLSVLVTDGIQASPPRKQKEEQQGFPCLGGVADPDCLANLLVEKVKNNYGVWMALIYLPFDGFHYPERPLGEFEWKRIEDHIKAIKKEPLFADSELPERPSGKIFEKFKFKGVKPLLILALSQDIRAGRDFIAQFEEQIKKSGIAPSKGVYTIELSPFDVSDFKIKDIKLSDDGGISVVKKRKEGFFDYLFETTRENKPEITITCAKTEVRGFDATAYGLSLETELVAVSGSTFSIDAKSIKKTTLGDETTFTISPNTQNLKQGKYFACLEVQNTLKLAPPQTSLPFWKNLSSDNIYERPERFYGLEDLVRKVMLESISRKKEVSDILRLRIERN